MHCSSFIALVDCRMFHALHVYIIHLTCMCQYSLSSNLSFFVTLGSLAFFAVCVIEIESSMYVPSGITRILEGKATDSLLLNKFNVI